MAHFDFNPQPGQGVPSPQGTILVRVTNNPDDDDRFIATVSTIAGSVAGATLGVGSLARIGTTVLFSGMIPAGVLPQDDPGSNNRMVTVQGFDGPGLDGAEAHAIRAWRGTGFDDSTQQVASGGGGKYRSGGPPMPVLLHVQPDAADDACAESADGVDISTPSLTLVHSQDPAFDGCWFSAPIDLRLGRTTPGFWMLRRSGAAWTLFLWCGGAVVVMYHRPAANEAADRLPMTLGLADRNTTGWPHAVTVSPAP